MKTNVIQKTLASLGVAALVAGASLAPSSSAAAVDNNQIAQRGCGGEGGCGKGKCGKKDDKKDKKDKKDEKDE